MERNPADYPTVKPLCVSLYAILLCPIHVQMSHTYFYTYTSILSYDSLYAFCPNTGV